VPAPATTPSQRRAVHAKRLLAERGLLEAVTFSFMRRDWAELFGGGAAALALVNPISADLDQMRPSLLPNLLAAAGRNAARGYGDVALFEVGPRYEGIAPKDQRLTAAALRAGRNAPRHWAAAPRPVDLFDAKADALALLTALGAPVENLQTTTDAPAQVLASAAGDDALHGDAAHPQRLREPDHALHPLPPLAEHVVRQRVQRLRGRIEEVPEHVDFAAVQFAGELDAGNEPHPARLRRLRALREPRHGVVVGHCQNLHARGSGRLEQLGRRAVAVAVDGVRVQVDHEGRHHTARLTPPEGAG